MFVEGWGVGAGTRDKEDERTHTRVHIMYTHTYIQTGTGTGRRAPRRDDGVDERGAQLLFGPLDERLRVPHRLRGRLDVRGGRVAVHADLCLGVCGGMRISVCCKVRGL